ncbi:helix-turn-helix domain-containing protein [Mesorhizobium sp. WSM4982]|uniref:helix-turn-helix domain-containing protein n=1 Tax=Mesorhizobium sp. WSM4982 TaxID=3038550 RepID=UPI00241565F0|nr:helix-turn-helix domain-containing protein [Mesorhizobium sp. WSM4982]MDG4856407.1 helix-turn-helix domain-containing protein [Mesorhizobium sp. WSM4982]
MVDRTKLTTQQEIVMSQLNAGRSLTNLVAITCHGVSSLSSRIAELRKLGYPIEDRMETDQFERQYKVYFIKAAKVAAAEKELEA